MKNTDLQLFVNEDLLTRSSTTDLLHVASMDTVNLWLHWRGVTTEQSHFEFVFNTTTFAETIVAKGI